MTNGDIPAGWYAEPSGAGGERWWDGTRWTEHVRSGQPAAAVPAQPQVPAGWYPDPSGEQRQRWWDGTQWTEHVHPPVVITAAVPAVEPEVPEVEPEVPEVEPEPEPGPEPEPEPWTEPEEATPVLGSDLVEDQPEVPAGWYPDPTGGGGLRWWDGTRWTEHVHVDDSTSAADHAASGQAAQTETSSDTDATAAAIPAGWYPDPSGGGERWWTGEAWSEHVRATTDPEESGTPGS